MPRHEHLTADELKVLTLKEWATLNGFSFMTAKRLIAEGDGPRIIQLSPRRVGVRVIDNARWQEARLRKAAS
jgi:predicted DNA-binding transcriptional regulator AlpA